jgi:hypothetical protein
MRHIARTLLVWGWLGLLVTTANAESLFVDNMAGLVGGGGVTFKGVESLGEAHQAHHARLDSMRTAGVPENLIAFEAVRHQIPDMQVGGVPLGGLSVCKLLKRGRTLSQPFYALPSDVGEETCDLSQVLVAWKGWCDSGVRDAKGGVHFSQIFLPSVLIEQYGAWAVIRFNNYLKTGAQPTPADDAAALAYFQDLPATHDIRGYDVEIFPAVYVAGDMLPLRRRVPLSGR